MAKFKVGDKVRVDIRLADAHKDGRYGIDSECVWDYNAVRTIEEICGVSDGITGYTLSIGRGFIWPEYALVSAEPRREFIVLRRDGAKTIAELRHDREIIKNAVATCSEKDTFDFDTGAKLAFDRLMGREEPGPEPQPAHRFKVGDRVVTSYGVGYVKQVDNVNNDRMPYCIKYDFGCSLWGGSGEAKAAPAPEPPKFYTGKVFAEKSIHEGYESRNGKVFEFVNGLCINATPEDSLGFKVPSFDYLCKEASFTKWHEVKSDV